MMATEPSSDNPADASALSEPQQPVADAQDGPAQQQQQPPTINGTPPLPEDIANKRITSVEDQINSADVSVSGGSDTEASRAEWAKAKDGDKAPGLGGRAGSNSSSSAAAAASNNKKPATFKAVSVNKTFLAAKSSATGLSSKAADKPAAGSSTPPTGSAALSVSRPRLVAKTGGATGALSPRFSSVANGKAGAAPDPAAVWNKNRPVPPPEPKKFTDEELKKYGIHMASRLNEEDAQGQSKWADIDDDDEDWAPEAITWGDGTKTTLHTDEPPPPPPVPSIEPAAVNAAAAAAAAGGAVSSKGAAAALAQGGSKALTSSATAGLPTAPLPKSTGLPSGKGLILKSAAQEKPILIAKPPAPPAPAKSPWATLPPVDRTPVVPIEPPYASRGPSRDVHPSMRSHLPPLAREGAHDDFHRPTWRDRAPAGNRELFNSRSGRYEPVIVDRHGPPLRSDSLTRHPALLQRNAGPQMDQPEPSAAFQTSRTAQDVPFARRRGSSNVSGGSGSFLQRMGKPNDGPLPPPDFLEARRSSHAGSIEVPVSPAVLQRPEWASRPSPRDAFAVPHRGPPSADYHSGPPPPPLPTGPSAGPPPIGQQQRQPSQQSQPPLEDDIEFQKKLMREGVELARKRRLEEEAREEAARRERIQKKLDALGPPPERKSEMKEHAAAAAAATTTTTTTTRHPPVQIQQRVHSIAAPEQVSQHGPKAEDAKNTTNNNNNNHNKATEPKVEASREPLPTNVLPPTQPSHPSQPSQPSQQAQASPAQRRPSHGQELKPANAWPGSGPRPERFASWASGTPRNVWGSPDSDKGLGNGTFNPDLGRVSEAPAQPQQHSNATPSPIAPPSAGPARQGRPQAPPTAPLGLRSSRYAATSAPPSAAAAAAGTSGTDLANKWVAAVAENDKKISAQRLAERTSRDRQAAAAKDAQPTIKETWRPVHVPGDGTRHAATAAVEIQSSHPTAGGWKTTSRDDFTEDRASVSSSAAGIIGSGPSSVLSPPGAATTPSSRPSRFFPATRDSRADAGQAAESARPSSPSPPPPTMEGHPVYEGGDLSHPHVSLPRPHPVVKLPPSLANAQAAQQALVGNVWAARAAAMRDGSGRVPGAQQQVLSNGRAIVADNNTTPANWQDKINNLLNGGGRGQGQGQGQLPKHALIDAASKTALDQSMASDAATTVFLPNTLARTYSWEDVKAPATKPMAEECFEEQEMGSLPQIRFPHKAPEAAWQPALIHYKPLPKKFVVDALVREPFHFPGEVVGSINTIAIKFQGMAKAKVLGFPFSSSSSSSRGSRGGHGRPAPRHRGGPGHGPRSGGGGGGGKRETANTHGESETPRPTGRGGRGGYRSRGTGGGGGGGGQQGGGGQGQGSGSGAGGGAGGGSGGNENWSRHTSSKQTSATA